MTARRLLPLVALLASGCASLSNPLADAIPVRRLPEELLVAAKDDEVTIPLSLLGHPAQPVRRIVAGDVLGVWIDGILGGANTPPPLHVSAVPAPRDQRRQNPAVGYPIPVAEDGSIVLPMIDPLPVVGLTFAEVQAKIRDVYVTKQLLKRETAQVLVSLLQPKTNRIVVLRQETTSFAPTVQGDVVSSGKRGTGQLVELSADESDVLHALAATGGLPGLDAYNRVVVFRNGFRSVAEAQMITGNYPGHGPAPCAAGAPGIEIPLRVKCHQTPDVPPEAVLLSDGDVVFLEARDAEVFYTGGLLPSGEHTLPRDRTIDVVEAIAKVRGPILNGAFGTNNLSGNLLAPGIGNPSPSLLVVVRKTPGGTVPIRIDLNQALVDARERIVVKSGDLILLQEQPGDALARYFSQNFFNWTFSWQGLRSSNAVGILDVTTPQTVPARVGVNFLTTR